MSDQPSSDTPRNEADGDLGVRKGEPEPVSRAQPSRGHSKDRLVGLEEEAPIPRASRRSVLWLDASSQPEYATPEMPSIRDLIAAELAGERVLGAIEADVDAARTTSPETGSRVVAEAAHRASSGDKGAGKWLESLPHAHEATAHAAKQPLAATTDNPGPQAAARRARSGAGKQGPTAGQ